MIDFEPVGEFGNWLAEALRENEKSITSAASRMGLDTGTIYNHLKKRMLPTPNTLIIYSKHFGRPVSDLVKMISKDWHVKLSQIDRFNIFKLYDFVHGDFGRLLAEHIMTCEFSITDVANSLGIDRATISKHIQMKNRPTFSVIKIYSDYLGMPSGEIANMIDRDWRENKNE